jgi:Tetratricopeptide repeat
MIDSVAAAFEKKDYKTAGKLLKQLLKESPSDPWVKLYVGKLQEVSQKYQDAEKIYRRLLQNETNSKIVAQARQGLQRLKEIEQEERKRGISEAMGDDSASELGVLVLDKIDNELKTQAAQKFAKITQMDAYSARLLLPSRGWRLYKVGAIGSLKYYGEQLQQAKIPCFWSTLSSIQQIQVFQVDYFQTIESNGRQVTVVCHNQSKQLGSLTFEWNEVKARVTGLLPIFEEVVDRNVRGKLERKTQTQDYAQFCDLHIPSRKCILRIFDGGYQFQKGIEIAPPNSQNTVRINWNNLSNWLDKQLPHVKIWSDFAPFAETALDQNEMLSNIQSNVHLYRKEASNWDSAFQLYSGLIFIRRIFSV